jgi:hypothetical protein
VKFIALRITLCSTAVQKLMAEWEAHTPEEFQRKWGLPTGELMANTAIIQALTSSGVKDGQAVRRMVEEQLGREQYQHLFSYKAGGKTVVMTNPSAILKRAQSLAVSHAENFTGILSMVQRELSTPEF